jgi:hypothetical protein
MVDITSGTLQLNVGFVPVNHGEPKKTIILFGETVGYRTRARLNRHEAD